MKSAASGLVLLALLGCKSLTTRPNLHPFPLASADTVIGNPAAVIKAAQDGAVAAGMVIRAVSGPEGYLETRWFNVATRHSHRTNTDPGRLVRMRVWADLVTTRETQVYVETVYRRTIDPSVPDREVELVAEPGTPGDSLTQLVLAAVRKKFTAPKAENGK